MQLLKNVDFSPTISVFTLNVNYLNMPIKDRQTG